MIEKQKKAIMEARKPGKEEKIIPASSSDTDSSGSEVRIGLNSYLEIFFKYFKLIPQ